jgi:hypothetical protein
MRGLSPAILVSSCVLLASVTQYESAKRKIELIGSDQAAPGVTILLTSAELTAFAKGEIANSGKEGIRDPEVKLGDGVATGTAVVDVAKLMESPGKSPNWLLARMLEGEKPLAVTVRVESANGFATVHVERVELAGIPLEGSALQFLIKNVFLPRYPHAKIGEPFELSHNMEQIRVQPSNVQVKMAR